MNDERRMIIIGEGLNITNGRVREALGRKDRGFIRAVALAQKDAGADFMNVNIGPARRHGPELMEWVVETIRETVDLPLSLDTTNVLAMEAGLWACEGKALINSISARPERMEALMPMAKQYDSDFIGLTIGVDGIPRDEHERGLLAAELIAKADSYGIPEERIWIDPIALPVNSQQAQIRGCMEFVSMLPHFAPRAKSTCGLSNISSGAPAHLRGMLNRTYLLMLKRCGIHSVIADPFDKDLMAIARGELAGMETLAGKVMDGEWIEESALSGEERDYVKTAMVLFGRSIYCDSWLEL